MQVSNSYWLLLPPLIVLLALFYFRPDVPIDVPTLTFENGTVVYLEIADTEEERRQGLSERARLNLNSGLLFVHDARETPTYWMKDMLIPLDFIWIDDGVVVGLDENAEPETSPSTFYSPPSPITHVLEVNAGFIELHDISVGNSVDIKIPNK
jgi:uncharacterized protein